MSLPQSCLLGAMDPACKAFEAALEKEVQKEKVGVTKTVLEGRKGSRRLKTRAGECQPVSGGQESLVRRNVEDRIR